MNAIEYLIDLNRIRVGEFEEDAPRRIEWRRQHGVEVGWFGCMDGRFHPPTLTETPLGLWPVWQNLGGAFDFLSWPRFQNSVERLWKCAVDKGRALLLVPAYHYSRSDNDCLGCRAHNYNLERARAASQSLTEQFRYVFGNSPDVAAICVGVNTDDDEIVFHGCAGSPPFDLGDIVGAVSDAYLYGAFETLYPNLPERIATHLVELSRLNLEHVVKVKAAKRPVEHKDHGEWILGVGQGFDWLHLHNQALIVGPFDPNFPKGIATASALLQENMKRPSFSKVRGIVLMASAQFSPDAGGAGRKLAEVKARQVAEQARVALRRKTPEMLKHIQALTVTINMDTRKMHILDED